MLVRKLELDQTQQVKVREILDNTRQKIEKVAAGVRASMVDIRENSDQQIMAVLTPQQQEKFKALKKEAKTRCFGQRRGWRCGQMSHPGGNNPDAEEELPPPVQE